MAESASNELAVLIQRALDEGPFSMQQLADQAGVSYDSLYSWARGRRIPRADNLRQLAAGFDDRAEALRKVAGQLRRAADSM